MPPFANLAARQGLLDEVVDYIVHHGLSDLSFRPLARALGTSPNRLVHHFGSREAMLEAALQRMIERHRSIEAGWLARRPTMSQTDLLRRWWKWMLVSPTNAAQVRVYLEAATLTQSISGLSSAARADQIGTWRVDMERRLIDAGMSRAEAEREATILKGVFSGLTLDLVVSGDGRRVTRALEAHFTELDRKLADVQRRR